MRNLVLIIILLLSLNVNKSYSQYITNYSLGKGYKYFKSYPKSVFISDILKSAGGSETVKTMIGEPWFLRNLREDQEKEQSSLLNLLKQKNLTLAEEYKVQLDKLSELHNSGEKLGVSYYKPIFPRDSENPELYYKWTLSFVNILEVASEKYKNIQNVYTEMEIEQNQINEQYKNTKDSIVHLQKQKFIVEKQIYVDQLDEIQKDSNSFQAKIDKITSTIYNKYEVSNTLLKKEMRTKINLLPQSNFIKNKAIIIQKYDKLISAKLVQANEEIKNAEAKFTYGNELGMKKYEQDVDKLSQKITMLTNKLNDIENNLEEKLPSQPKVDEKKYLDKINKIENDVMKGFNK